MGINWENAAYDEYLKLFDALSNPIRLRILGILFHDRQYVSELARQLNISRPLLYMHLRKLEEAGLVEGSAEISPSGKANKFFQCTDFHVELDMEMIAALAGTIPQDLNSKKESTNEKAEKVVFKQ